MISFGSGSQTDKRAAGPDGRSVAVVRRGHPPAYRHSPRGQRDPARYRDPAETRPPVAAESDAEEAALELAFYDALETNDSAVKVLGEPTLSTITRELVATVRKNVTIEWTLLENVCAQMRVLVRRILRKYRYPPDKQEKATQTVLEQAALFSETWAAAA